MVDHTVLTLEEGLRLTLGKDGVYFAPHPGGASQMEILHKRNAAKRQERLHK